MSLLCLALRLFLLVLFVRIIMSWIPMRPGGGAHRFAELLGRVTDPVLVPVRRVVPPLRTRTVAFDLSPVVVVVGISVLMGIIC